MKKYLLILLSAIALSSCEASDNDDAKLITAKPSIATAIFYCAFAGSNSSQALNLDIVIPEGVSISKLSWYTKSGEEVNFIDNPKTGKYTLLYHMNNCHNISPGLYYFVFTKTDGTKVITEAYPKP